MSDQPLMYKFVGRKFIGFVAATTLLILGYIPEETWFMAFITYCAADVVEKLGVFKKGA